MEDLFDMPLNFGSRRNSGFGALIFILFIGVVIGFFFIASAITRTSVNEFQLAKKNKQFITCNALFKTHLVKPENYTIYTEHIEVKTFLWKKNFKLQKCHIEEK